VDRAIVADLARTPHQLNDVAKILKLATIGNLHGNARIDLGGCLNPPIEIQSGIEARSMIILSKN
jgi:hypothetical protein